jgi:hypothetical protein
MAFGILSVADFALTRHLLYGSDTAYEANPVAGWLLARHGWVGLALFKVAAAAVVVGLAAVVHRHRPRAGTRLVGFGCSALAFVVVYSAALAVGREARIGPEADAVNEDQVAAQLQAARQTHDAYRAVLGRVSEQVACGQTTLADGVEELARTDKATDSSWLHGLHTFYPGLSDRGCMAASLVQYALGRMASAGPVPSAELRRLLTELYAYCGTDSPASFGSILERYGPVRML